MEVIEEGRTVGKEGRLEKEEEDILMVVQVAREGRMDGEAPPNEMLKEEELLDKEGGRRREEWSEKQKTTALTSE